jgi:hypothetical protein
MMYIIAVFVVVWIIVAQYAIRNYNYSRKNKKS